MDNKYRQIEKYQEMLYLGNWDTNTLISTLDTKIESCYDNPQALLEVIYILKILREVQNPDVADPLIKIIESHIDFWPEEAGVVIILEILDLVVAFKRQKDIDYITSMITWDLFQIPSHILLLVRRYGWIDLWNNISTEYDLSVEYDNFIRKQFHETKDVANTFADLYFTPVIYVEGKTDKEIINIAWKKLYKNEIMPFRVKECDPLAGFQVDNSGGTGTLSKLISTIRDDSPNCVIAIFDNDKEGNDVYSKLPNYLEEYSSLCARIAKHNKAAAFLLPVPQGKEKYAEYLNLSIEFYFNDTALSLRTPEGFGLEFRYPQLETRVKRHGSPVVEIRESDIPETREITGGKAVFAEKIVPLLDSSEFETFKLLFQQIKQVLAYMGKPE